MSEMNEMGKKVETLMGLPVGLLKDAARAYARRAEEYARFVVDETLDGHELYATVNRERYEATVKDLSCIIVAVLALEGEKR